jgi:hypothetical protein
MTYFNSREIAAIALCAALWGILNAVLSPAFFAATHMPFLCDVIGFGVLTLAAWWTHKPGAITLIGLIATAVNFIVTPGGVFFLGFTVASLFFDVATVAVGYPPETKKSTLMAASMIGISIASAAVAGYLIGVFLMPPQATASAGGAIGWAGLHAVGGVIGGAVGSFLVLGLKARKVAPSAFEGKAATA